MSTSSPHQRTLSHSQIEQWQQCQFRWYLRYVAHAPAAPSEQLILGDAVHAAIAEDGVRRLEWIDRRLGLPALLQVFNEALEKRLAEDDPGKLLAGRVMDLRLRGLAILSVYVEQVQPRYTPCARPEEQFEVAIPDLDGWRFTGIVDARIFAGTGGIPTIVDWKTASRPWPDGAEHQKAQATAYLWAERQRIDAHRAAASRVTFVVFTTTPRSGQLDPAGYTCSAEFRSTIRVPQQLAAYEELVRGTAHDITRRALSPVKSVKTNTGPLCGWCPYLGSCPSGRFWLHSHDRQPAVPVVAGVEARAGDSIGGEATS